MTNSLRRRLLHQPCLMDFETRYGLPITSWFGVPWWVHAWLVIECRHGRL
jgi:hypothetical protein